MRRVLDSPPVLAALVIILLLSIGIGWTFGPREYSVVFLLLGFATIFIGGTTLIVMPRVRVTSRLAADRSADAVSWSAANAGFLRRAWWWSLTWTINSLLPPAECSARAQAIVEARKEASEWPFGDSTTKLLAEPEGFSTAPGWLWNAPYKPLVTGWVMMAPGGSAFTVTLRMAYDPAFEVLFTTMALLIAAGFVVAFIQQGSTAGWELLPLGFVPLAIVIGFGQLGRWRVKRAGTRLVTDVAAAVGGTVTAYWPGWRILD